MKKRIAQYGITPLIALSLFVPTFFARAEWSVLGLNNGLPQGTIYGIITSILTWLLGAIGIIAIIGFLIAGMMYIISTGDDDGAKKAKSAMKNSIIGIIVALSGYVAIQAIDSMLNAYDSF
jgi:hypothetical protein